MEKADVVNKALREDVEKLTVDWSRARDELIRKENQWRMEQEVGGTGAGTVRGGLVLWALTTLVSVGRGLLEDLDGNWADIKVSDHPHHSCWQLTLLGPSA